MSKFSAIEISSIVTLHPKVESRKFLGLFERTRYQPTHSPIESYRNYYDQREADLFQQIAESSNPGQRMIDMKEMQTSKSQDYRVDLCISHDCQFVAFQVFVRQQDEYAPYSKLCFLEGNDASAFENLLA